MAWNKIQFTETYQSIWYVYQQKLIIYYIIKYNLFLDYYDLCSVVDMEY